MKDAELVSFLQWALPRLGLRWAGCRREIEATRTGFLGVSAGAIFGAVLMAVEPGIRRAALVFPGGDLPEIVRTSQEPEMIAWREALMAKLGSDEAVTHALRAAIVSDPQRLAPFVDPARLLLFLGADDTKVPVARGEALRAALGDPETWRLAGDHDTAVLCFGFLLREIDAFLFNLG